MKYQPSNHENLSEAVIQALAAEEDTPPENFQPLYESVDPDALDALVSNRPVDWVVEFEHGGYRIRVEGSGEIRLNEAD